MATSNLSFDKLASPQPVAEAPKQSPKNVPISSASSTSYTSVEIFTVVAVFVITGFRLSKTVRFVVRFLGFIGLFVIIGTTGILVAIYERLTYGDNKLFLHKRSLNWIVHNLSPLLFNVRYEVVSGKEHLTESRPCVFIMNHQSEMDIMVLSSYIPQDCVVMMKEEFKKIPLIGSYVTMTGDAVFIKRQSHSSAIETITQVGVTVKERNVPIFLFPEGTRSYQTTNELLPFKKGAFHLAVGAQIPIIPIVAESYHSIYSLKNLLFEGGVIKVKVLPPISTEGMDASNVTDLTERCRSLMLKTLIAISQPPPSYAKPLKTPHSSKKKDE